MTGKARPEGAGSTFEQLLEFAPDAIVGVVREGKIVLFAVRRDGTAFPIEVDLSSIETADETIAAAAVRDVDESAEPGLVAACGIKAERHLRTQSTTNTRR